MRAGGLIVVSGTVAANEDGTAAAVDAYGQARHVFRVLDDVLRRLGGRLESVLRLRVHFADAAVGPDFLRAFAEAFPRERPALTTVHVVALHDPAFLLEVEADAAVADWRPEAPGPPDWDEPVD